MSNPLDAGFSTPVATAGPRTTFFENFEASYDQVYRNDSFLGLEGEVQSRWEDTVRKYNARLGRDSGAPVDMRSINELITPIVDPTGERGFQSGFLGAGEEGEYPTLQKAARENAHRVNEELRALNDPALPSIEKILEEVIAARKEVDTRVQQVEETSGFAGLLGRFAGGVGGSFTLRDPIQLASLAVGGVGRSAAMRIGTEMLANAAAEGVVVETGINPTRRALGEPEQDVLASAVVAGLGAGILRGGAEGLGLLARRALGESPDFKFDVDFQDEQLRQLFERNIVNPEARAGLVMLEGQQRFEAVNPYGNTEAGMKRFTGELEEIVAGVSGRTNTAIARFIEPETFTLDNLSFEMRVVREEQPLLFQQLEQATERLQELDARIVEQTAAVNNVSAADGVRRIDEASADLVVDYEATARNTALPRKVREDAAKKMDQIIKSLGEEAVIREVNDAGIAPQKELQALRASRKAAAKQFKAARTAVDKAVARNQAEARVKEMALGKPQPANPTPAAPINTQAQRYDVVEDAGRAVDEADKALLDADLPITRLEDGGIDLGGGLVLPKGFELVDGTGATVSAEALLARLDEDAALVDAMRTCSV